MGDISITDGSVVRLREDSRLSLNDDSKLTIKSIDEVKNIDPVAVHLKEVNHIDPLSIDALHVSEVKNIDPIEITRFNVTNLPMVNVSVQKLPTVGIDLKSLPPVSVGTHQNFCVPSDYTLHARLLGIELVRLRLHGQTSIFPQDRARREQARSDQRSFPLPSVAGNPAIPSHCEGGDHCRPCSDSQVGGAVSGARPRYPAATVAGQHAGFAAAVPLGPSGYRPPAESAAGGRPTLGSELSLGTPGTGFRISDRSAKQASGAPNERPVSDQRVMSGD